MSKNAPPMNSKKRISIALLLISIVSLGGFFGDKAYKKHREVKAIEKWEQVQKETSQKGIYTDIDAYLESISGEGPALFEDFPWVVDFMDHDTETVFEIHELRNFKELSLPSTSNTHEENIEALRVSLSTPPAKGASEQEIYQAILAAIAPADQELNTFKDAVAQSNSLGHVSGKDELFFFNASSCRAASDLFLLRNYCNLQLGSKDLSDIKTVTKFCRLIDQHGAGLISLTVSIAIDLTNVAIINTYTNSPNALPETVKRMLPCIPKRNFAESYSRQMQLEYTLQLYLLQQLKDGRSHIIDESDPLNHAPQHIRNELLADSAEFNLKLYFNYYSTSPNLLHPDYLTSSFNVEHEDYSTPSKELISVLGIGIEYYLTSALKAQLNIDTAQISTAIYCYNLDHHTFPTTLDQLVPAYLSKLPSLPYGSAPYTYTSPTVEGQRPTITGTIHLKRHDDISVTWPDLAKP